MDKLKDYADPDYYSQREIYTPDYFKKKDVISALCFINSDQTGSYNLCCIPEWLPKLAGIMKKNLLFLVFICFSFLLKAQNIDKAVAMQLVKQNLVSAGLSGANLADVIVSDAYHDASTGLDMIYLQQSFKGIPVYNQIQVLAFKNGLMASTAGGRIASIEKMTGTGEIPSVSASQAVTTAITGKNISYRQQPVATMPVPGKKINFGKLGIANEDITAELLWVLTNDGKKIRLAWQVYLVPLMSSDYWMIRVDAKNNKVIDENNLTVYCNWDPSKKGMISHDHLLKQPAAKPALDNAFDFSKYAPMDQRATTSPTIVNAASYRVIPFPAESPRHPGGSPALVNDPWALAPGNATSLKWHSNGTTDYTITRGNNVWAKEDQAANNSTAGLPATSTTTPDPLTFNFIPDFSKRPNQASPVPNRQFNTTNLFYWINTFHDVMYQYGFDEPAGNFQANNQGRGGAGNDFVFGDAQDGNFTGTNQNNANFSTPADGGSGRMQMYMWDTAATLTVNTPASIGGVYTSIEGGFSAANRLINLGPVTGQVVYYNDNAAGTTHEACAAPANAAALAGKIALIDRGNCNFTVKVKNAQLAGAIAVIMVNNIDGVVLMGGADNTIIIPAVFITQDDGVIFKAQLANNLNITLYATTLDGDVDNGVIVHEHGHGLSNRLTGGPAQAGCLANAEQAGEGWSDYYGLMFTQDWASSNLNTGFTSPRGIGTYVVGQIPSGSGIRTQRYCTDFAVNNLVYTASLPANPLVHDRGEIWCATLWDMTWDIINQVGSITPDIHNATSAGGNVIALRLVTEGMKLQPCSPGFIDGRNAILKADSLLYGAVHACVIKEAFRKRGMGPNATQGSSNSVTDQAADFAAFNCSSCAAVTTTTQPANTTACTGTNANFSVTVTGTTPAYQWQVSTNGGTTYTPVAGQTAATLTLNAVTTAMSGNLYQVVISNSCPSTITSTAAVLTVNSPGSITLQPANFAACAGATANFSVTAAGSTNTYQWQVSTDGGATFTDITGATTTSLSLPAVTASMNGSQYHLVITSCGPGGLTSSNVTLTVNSPASITAQPTNTSACTGGGDATFTVAAGGNSISYQWQVSTNGGTSFTNIPGATANSLTVTGITSAMNNNIYQVIISNPCTASLVSSQATLSVSNPASISTQPVNATVCAGTNTSYNVATAGTGVTYQWQVSIDGGASFTDIPGATAATLNLNAVTSTMNNNQYHVLVFSCSPTGLSSSDVTLTVNSSVAVTSQPVNSSACVGTDVTLTVTADGTANTYQWQVSTDGGTSFSNIAGATSASLVITSVTAGMNNNIYHVLISNLCTAVAISSGNATLTVSNTATITAQPVNATACAGTNAVFAATASGASYQWQSSTDNGVTFNDISGATSTTLSLTAVTASMNSNQYQLIIAGCGAASISSAPVTLTVNSPAAVATQPANTTVCTGSNTSFTVSAAGTSPAYQWSVSNDGGATYTAITGATAATLTITGATAAMNNNLYQVTLSNSCSSGVISTAGLLTVSPATSISIQAADFVACEGSTANFTVTADNAAGATYQWQVSTDAGISFTDITGANGAVLNLPAVTTSTNNNVYRVVVTGCGTATSAGATLTVNPLPVVSIAASPYLNLSSGMSTTITATAVPAATTFSWFKNGVPVAGVTGNTITVTYDNLGAYNATVTDLNSCSNASNIVTIADSIVNIAFIYPNPNDGFFHVRFKDIPFNGQPRFITMYDAKGARVYFQAFYTATAYQIMDVRAEKLSTGVYVLILSDASGTTLGAGKVVIR